MRVNKNKKEIAIMLNKSYSTIKHYSAEKLALELKKIGYMVLEITKKGREVIYEMENKERIKNLKELIEEDYNVDYCSFVEHTRIRVDFSEKCEPITQKSISDKVGVSVRTIQNYDKKLLDKEVLTKDGYYYICVDNATRKKVLVDRRAYSNFWSKNKIVKEEMDDLMDRLISGNINRKSFDYLYDTCKKAIEGDYYYYRVEKFYVNYDSELYKLVKKEGLL